MRQADIKQGTVYVGKCGIRFRRFEGRDICGLSVFRAARIYAGDSMQANRSSSYDAISHEALARWAAREATTEETAAFERVMGVPRG